MAKICGLRLVRQCMHVFAVVLCGPPAVLCLAPMAHAATVQDEFYGLHIVQAYRHPATSAWPSVRFGVWRLNLPELHWFSLEPRRGEWRWAALDRAVALAESNGVKVLLPLGETPTWASSNPTRKGPYVKGQFAAAADLRDWQTYVRAVARRYAGRVQFYEIWNEPALTETDGSKGYMTAAVLARMAEIAYREIKAADPSAKVTSPAMVGGEKGAARLDAFLAAGGRRYVDIVSFHFYCNPPERLLPMVELVRGVMRRHGLEQLPLWNTEFGYLIADPDRPNTHPLMGGAFDRVLDEMESPGYVARSLILGAAAGLGSFSWHGWDLRNMSLTYADGRPNPAGRAYGTVQQWLSGASLESCAVNHLGTWSCAVVRGGAISEVIAWRADSSRSVECGLLVPRGARVASYEPLLGAPVPVAGNCELRIGPMPVRITLAQ